MKSKSQNKSNNDQYEVEFIMAEYILDPPEKGYSKKYLIKYKHYDFHECIWSKSVINTAPKLLSAWDTLSQKAKDERLSFLNRFMSFSNHQKKIIGQQYINTFLKKTNKRKSLKRKADSSLSQTIPTTKKRITNQQEITIQKDRSINTNDLTKYYSNDNDMSDDNDISDDNDNYNNEANHKNHNNNKNKNNIINSNKTINTKNVHSSSFEINIKKRLQFITEQEAKIEKQISINTKDLTNYYSNHNDMSDDIDINDDHKNNNKNKTKNKNKNRSKNNTINKSKNKNKNNEKCHLVIMLLGTKVNPDDHSRFNGKEDRHYFHVKEVANKNYPAANWVGWAQLSSKQTIIDYIACRDPQCPETIWLKEKQKKKSPFDNYVAYNITDYGPLDHTPITSPSIRRGRIDLDENELKVINKVKRIQELKNKYNIKIYGLVIDSYMISLILDGKKDAEFRGSNLFSLQSQTKNCKKNDTNNLSYKPDPIPTRKSINHKPIPSETHWTSAIPSDWKEQHQQYLGLEDEIIEELTYEIFSKHTESWLFFKRYASKNKNLTIKRHNNQIILFLMDVFRRLCYWEENSYFNDGDFVNRQFRIVKNFIIYIFCIPWHMERALKDITNHKHLIVPITHILGLIHIQVCNQCKKEMCYKPRKGKNTSKFRFFCSACKKASSAWNGTILQQFRYQSIPEFLLHLFSCLDINRLKKQKVDGIIINQHYYRLIRIFIEEQILIFVDHNYLICGKKTVEIEQNLKQFEISSAQIDHAHVGKNKYGRGYQKGSTKFQIIGFHDIYGIYIYNMVSAQNRIETEYQIQKHTQVGSLIDTDCAKCFNGIFLLERKHRQINHSGEIIQGKKVRFYNPSTGACTNAIEGGFGKLCQHLKMQRSQYLSTPEMFATALAVHDLRYNRTDNIPEQLLINALMIINTVSKPGPTQKWLEQVPGPIFKDIFYVDKIIGEDVDENGIPMYLVKWDYTNYVKSTWQHEKDFHDKSTLTEWQLLPQKEKNQRFNTYKQKLKQYNLSLKEGIKKPGYKVNDWIFWSSSDHLQRAKEIIKNKQIKNCQKIDSNSFTSVIQSKSSNQYQVEIEFYSKSKSIKRFKCECKYFKRSNDTGFKPPSFCKHIVAVLLWISCDKERHLLA